MRLLSTVVLVVGAAVCGLPFVGYLSDVPPAEYAIEARDSGMGAMLLYSPYAALAALGRNARPWAGLVALSLLLLGSAVFFLVASSDAQGGLVGIYILPAQWLVAVYAGDDRFRRPGKGAQADDGVR